MSSELMQKIDAIIQEWIRDNKRLIATPELIISKLIEAGLFPDDEDSLKVFVDKIKKLTKKEQRKYLNIYSIGSTDIRFKNRECY